MHNILNKCGTISSDFLTKITKKTKKEVGIIKDSCNIMPEWAWKPLWQIYPEWNTNFGPFFFPFCLFWQFSRWARGRNQSLERSFSWMVCRNNEASRSFLVSLLADWLDDWFSLIPHSNEAEEGKAYNGQILFLKVHSLMEIVLNYALSESILTQCKM